VSYGDRLARAGERVEELELGALLLTDLVNIRYLTGFTGSNAMLVVAPAASVFLTDFRYVERAQPLTEFTDVRRGERDMLAELEDAVRELADGGALGFEEGNVTVARHRRRKSVNLWAHADAPVRHVAAVRIPDAALAAGSCSRCSRSVFATTGSAEPSTTARNSSA